ncbi:hypothetical protein CIG75_06545 [Tumebacillus algifaecis]|uniref:Peptidase C39-like domain-containing protein n=1 Tax=Tumebacillus algifaecis TaxID=1214604 RepID=A0A223CZA0_9BACL|nr:C39 family peptidase [Tumebacillus algifaecis]ASS74662.1 hypothetical protein CIG75_06545 [Tumebacillus algifaecis]
MRLKRYAYLTLALAAALTCLPTTAAEAASQRIWGVPVYGQYPELPAGCEAAAVTMIMNWAGAKVSKSDVAAAIARQPMFWSTDGILFGGDPHEGFVGNPFEKEGSFGVFAKPLVTVVDRYLPGRGVDLSGKTFDDLLRVIDNGQPVAAWVTNYLEEPKINANWRTRYGRTITWRSPEHVMTIVGYNDTQIIVNDPANGTVRTYARDRFRYVWETMGRHALTISFKPQAKFSVYQYSRMLKEFPTYEEGVQHAKMWDHAKVVEKSTGLTKWDNYPARVTQNNRYVNDFKSQTGAIGFAEKYSNAKVIDVTSGKVIWNNWPKLVYQGSRVIKTYAWNDVEAAIAYGKLYANSRVVDSATDEVLWRFQ